MLAEDNGPMGTKPTIFSISHLTGMIRDALQRSIPSVWVRGEISDLARPHSGHLYFTLKDGGSQIRAVMWRTAAQQLAQPLEDGQTIVCFGEVEVYGPRGVYQLVVRKAEAKGIGALQQRLLRLQKQLAAEGLFDAAHKRPLPRFPRRLAVVSSPTGAAIQDFLQVVRRRWRGLAISLIPCRVQGQGAATEIAAAIRAAGRLRPAPDVVIVTRGGGSLEDLWSFNEETVVRAIHDCPHPVVAGIGHEIDVTLSDLAADVRALTPTEAAERVAPSGEDVSQWLSGLSQRLAASLRGRAETARARVDALAQSAALTRPLDRIHHLDRRLDELAERAKMATQRLLERQSSRMAQAAAQLEALSPLGVLNRGYSVTRTQRLDVINDVNSLSIGEPISTQFASGWVISRIEQINPGPISIDPLSSTAGTPRGEEASGEEASGEEASGEEASQAEE